MKHAALLLASLSGWAQTRDFLTADEVDRVRETAPDPNARLNLYAQFAKLRVDLIQSTLAKEKAGRSIFVHDTLEDYTRIIETIDTVIEDALKRDKDITESMGAVTSAEKGLLEVLEKIQQDRPPDLARYAFVLASAIETTRDSIELSEQDLATRKKDVVSKAAQEKKQREDLMTPEDAKKRREESKKTADTETQQKRKIPSLRRKGDPDPKKQP